MSSVCQRLAEAAALTEKQQVQMQGRSLGSPTPGLPRPLDGTHEQGLVPANVGLDALDPGEPVLVAGLTGDQPGFVQMPHSLRNPLSGTGPAGEVEEGEHDIDVDRAPRVAGGEASQ